MLFFCYTLCVLHYIYKSCCHCLFVKLSLIVPVYNEASVLASNIIRIYNTLSQLGISFEIILCNDGSTDNSLSIIKKIAFQYSQVRYISFKKNRGKGYVVTKAFSIAKGDWLCFIDADLDIDSRFLTSVCQQFKDDYDLIIGSKHHPKSLVKMSFLRLFLSRSYSFFARFFLSINVSDFQCGLKCISRKAFLMIHPYLRSFSWSWDTELLLCSHAFGFKIKEIPVACKISSSHLHLLSDSFKMGRDLLRLFFSYRSVKSVRYYNERAQNYDKNRRHGLTHLFIPSEANNVLRYIREYSPRSLLDFGCGSGYYAQLLTPLKLSYFGVDISSKMISVARKNGVSCCLGDIHDVKLRRKFDIVLISGALEFCYNPSIVLSNAFNHINPSGVIFLIFPRRNIFGLFYYFYHFFYGTRISLSRKSFACYDAKVIHNNLLSDLIILKLDK